MAFSYSPSELNTATALGRRYIVRLLVGDTADTTDKPAIFDDSEIDTFLDLQGDSVFYAGAQACEVWATTHSRLAKRMERDGSIHERWSPKELLAVADRLRTQAVSGSAAGTLQTGIITSSRGEYAEEWRPTWWNLNGTPTG